MTRLDIRHIFRRRNGNIVTVMLGMVAMVGVTGVAAFNLIGGPITTASKVTHQNMAQNDLLMNAKVVVMHASTLPQMGDEDSDGYVEPVAFIPTTDNSCNITLPAQGGCLPLNIGVIQTDPWGRQYAYCVWDHGDPSSSDNRIDGEDSTSGAVLAILSAGPNKQFETPCLPYDGDPDTNDQAIDPKGVGDDLVQIYTYAAAVAGSGGLWELKLNEPETAIIDKKLEVGDVAAGTGFAFDTATGTGVFPYVKTDYLASKSGGTTPVTMDSNIALDGRWLSGDGGNRGIFVDANGKVGMRTSTPEAELHISAPSYSGTVNPLRAIVKAQMNPTSSNGFSIFEGKGASTYSPSLVHGLKLDLQGGSGDRHYGFYIEGESRNYLSGKLGIGVTAPSSALHVYQSHAQLQDTPDAMVMIEGQNVDNFVTENRDAPTLLKVKTRYGNVPNGHLFSAENHLRRFRVSNFGNVFANVVEGDEFYPAVINPSRPTSYYSLLGTSLKSSNWFDGRVPIIGNSINLNVTGWGGSSPGLRSIYGVPVKIRGANSSASSTAFYADVADADKNWAFFAKAGNAYFADRVGIGTENPTQKLHLSGENSTQDGLVEGVRVSDPSEQTNAILRTGGGLALIRPATVTNSPNTNGFVDFSAYPNLYPEGRYARILWDDSNNTFWLTARNEPTNTLVANLSMTGSLNVTGSTTAAAYYQSSDQNLKTNIERILDPFTLLKSIEGKRFVWKDSKKPAYGVIAQDVEAVMPDAIGINDEGFKTVEYNQLIAPLIEAVNQLKIENETLRRQMKAENDNLREEIRALIKGAQ